MTKKPFSFPEIGPHAVRPWAVRKGYADEHFLSDYRFQFPREDPELAAMVHEFREEEREHRDAALAAGAERAPAYPLLSGAIRLGCRAAIKLAERI